MHEHEIKITATYRGIEVPPEFQGLSEYDYGLSNAWTKGVDAVLDNGKPSVENDHPNTRVFKYVALDHDLPNRWYVQGGTVLFWSPGIAELGLRESVASISDLTSDLDWAELDSIYLGPDQFKIGGKR